MSIKALTYVSYQYPSLLNFRRVSNALPLASWSVRSDKLPMSFYQRNFSIKSRCDSLAPYQALCTEFYELDKPRPPPEALKYYLSLAKNAKGPILEPMCGSGRFFIPLLHAGYDITGFDSSQHMLDLCVKKCADQQASKKLFHSGFKEFSSRSSFKLVFIPTGSFCLLTKKNDAEEALQVIFSSMSKNGKFVLEVDTPNSVSKSPGIWKGKWLNKPDQTKLVLNTLSKFDPSTRIDTTLCRYEKWERNHIIRTEVEEFQVRVYDEEEIEGLLSKSRFKIIKKTEPYTNQAPSRDTETILYECKKI